MTVRLRTVLGASALVLAFAAILPAASLVQAQSSEGALKTLREEPLTDLGVAPEVLRQSTPAEGFGRAYRQQPPLIPHKVDAYQVTINNNQCMDCHDWPGNKRVNAPKISETHYVDRQGARLDKVAGTRYFCPQCHVPQADAKPLVGNIFQNATQAK
jgi:cytochrome c-type protein NapB